jgi:hypothetical protein
MFLANWLTAIRAESIHQNSASRVFAFQLARQFVSAHNSQEREGGADCFWRYWRAGGAGTKVRSG